MIKFYFMINKIITKCWSWGSSIESNSTRTINKRKNLLDSDVVFQNGQ